MRFDINVELKKKFPDKEFSLTGMHTNLETHETFKCLIIDGTVSDIMITPELCQDWACLLQEGISKHLEESDLEFLYKDIENYVMNAPSA